MGGEEEERNFTADPVPNRGRIRKQTCQMLARLLNMQIESVSGNMAAQYKPTSNVRFPPSPSHYFSKCAHFDVFCVVMNHIIWLFIYLAMPNCFIFFCSSSCVKDYQIFNP